MGRAHLLGLALARAHHDVDREDVILIDRVLGHLLFCRHLVDDRLVRVDDEALHLMREDALDGRALEALRDRRDRLRDLVVLRSLLEHPLRHLGRRPRRHDHIRLATLRLDATHKRGVRDDGDVAVHVHAQVNLDQVALHERHLVLGDQRRVVAHAVVDRDARRESDPLLDELLAVLFLVVDLAHRFVDVVIACVAQLHA